VRQSGQWLMPRWPAPPNVQAVCTTRAGGRSLPPYDSLNLGDRVGDSPQAVAANRRHVGQALRTQPVFLHQVHGHNVVELREDTPDGTEADGCVTRHSGLACTIMVADCLPVLFADEGGFAVAAAHAGWRGLAGVAGPGILEQVWQGFWPLTRMQRAQAATKTIAWLGPCIGPDAFEVGPEVKAAFELHDRQAGAMFKPHGTGKWLADLQGLARQRLAALGITQVYGNDGGPGWCTFSNASRFFSHRRDKVSGRFAAAVWLS
jgi:YfiH family protein